MVLAGVDEQLLVALAQPARDRRGLDELRPVADDRDDSQRLARIEIETYAGFVMTRKLIGNALGAVEVAAGMARHVLWYLSYQVDGTTRVDPR